MSKRIFKDGCRMEEIEFEVRTIDAYGDSQDVSHFEIEQEAIAYAKREAGSAVAVVVEKHFSRYPAHLFAKPSDYKILATYGDRDALQAGGWID